MSKLIFLSEGMRIFNRRINVYLFGWKKHKGNSAEICKKIIEDAYDKKKNYFRVSNGHFCEFYSRDFGWVCESLIKLGYKEKVRNTLRYALSIYRKSGKITVAINPNGKCFDFPNYAVDSLPYIMNSLAILDDKKLVEEYKDFLQREVYSMLNKTLDIKTGLVRPDKTFSSIKDHSIRKSSCYDLCMLYLLQKSCKKLDFKSGIEDFDYHEIIMEKYWTGKYFLDDLSGRKYVAGDANVFPFWTELVNDKKIMIKAFDSMIAKGLDKPIPLRYTTGKADVKLNTFDNFASEYEKDTCWMHIGLLYLGLWKNLDKDRFEYYCRIYRNMIERNRNFLELFYPNGKPFKTFLYHADENMIWCANYLEMITNR